MLIVQSIRRMGFLATLLLLALTPSTRASTTATPLRLKVQGEGPVTVVFEAGLGDTLEVWRKVQERVAAGCARTVSYNRAGYAGSAPTAGERDAEAVVRELREALLDQGIAPPYVLVGHSLGGLYVQYFARQYPGEVTGLLLVDSTHWEQLQRIRQSSPAVYAQIKAMTVLMIGPMRREFHDSLAAGAQVQASPPLVNMPTIVLSSSRAAPGETPAFRQLLRRLQDDMADSYNARRHSFPIGSGHYIQRDRPADVIAAARELAGCQPR